LAGVGLTLSWFTPFSDHGLVLVSLCRPPHHRRNRADALHGRGHACRIFLAHYRGGRVDPRRRSNTWRRIRRGITRGISRLHDVHDLRARACDPARDSAASVAVSSALLVTAVALTRISCRPPLAW